MKLFHCCFLLFFVIFYTTSFIFIQRKRLKRVGNNNLIKVKGRISSDLRLQDNNYIFKLGFINIKIGRSEVEHALNQNSEIVVIGKPEKRVIGGFYQQIWLIDPQILKAEKRVEKSKIGSLGESLIEKLFSNIKQLLPEPHASLLAGILLGRQTNFSSNFLYKLRKTGTLHLIVASGGNLAFVANGIMFLFWQNFNMRRHLSILISFIFIMIYIVIVGLEPPIIRAGIMAFLVLLANFLGRQTTTLWVLILSISIMLLINPLLIEDISFQLSTASTFGLIIMAPKTKKYSINFFQNIWWGIRGEFQIALAAFLFTAPIIWFHFHQISFLGLLVNPLVNWIIPYIMFFGTILIILSFIWYPLAVIFQPFCWVLLNYFIKTIVFFG